MEYQNRDQCKYFINLNNTKMTVVLIKPGPKPKKDDGSLDKRRRVSPEKKPNYPPLKKHDHKKGD